MAIRRGGFWTGTGLALALWAGAAAALDYGDVLRMVEAELPEATVLHVLATHNGPMNLTVDQLIQLKRAGAADSVLIWISHPAGPAAARAESDGDDKAYADTMDPEEREAFRKALLENFQPIAVPDDAPALASGTGWLMIANHANAAFSLFVDPAEGYLLFSEKAQEGAELLPTEPFLMLGVPVGVYWLVHVDGSDYVHVAVEAGKATTLYLYPQQEGTKKALLAVAISPDEDIEGGLDADGGLLRVEDTAAAATPAS